MNKALALTTLFAAALSGCASMTYEANCALPLEKTPSTSAIKNSTKLIRENYVYTERVYYSDTEWVIFADKTGRDMNATQGLAHFIQGSGNLLKDNLFTETSVDFVRGEFDIDQSRNRCFALTSNGETNKGFLATSSAFPFTMKDENEASWKVDYFDFYYPSRVEKEGSLKLTHADASHNLEISYEGNTFQVNGEDAQLERSKLPVAEQVLVVKSTGDRYAFVGMQRLPSSGRFYVLKNGTTLLAYKGPKL